jgi:hypothetical protein
MPQDPERCSLEEALLVAQKIANNINEIKKRRDLVESIIDPNDHAKVSMVGKMQKKIMRNVLISLLTLIFHDRHLEGKNTKKERKDVS